jgi:hypothetical protein
VDWAEATELVIARTGHGRYRELTADDHPDHLEWRRRVVEKATGLPPGPAEYPSLFRQAANLAGAAVRVVVAAAQGGPVRVPPPVYYERLAVCRGCEFNGARPAGVHCTKCGCGGMKLEFATEACPVQKWPRWEAKPDGSDGDGDRAGS